MSKLADRINGGKCWLLPPQGITRRRYFLYFTLVFAVMTFAVFGIFFYNGKSFIWECDAWPQHYNALVYYAKWLRSIIENILFQHTFEIPLFNFSIGYGADILTTLHYYAIGDPLSALSVFVPTQFMALFYNFLVLLRLYLSGIAFSLFCFYKEDQIGESGENIDSGHLFSKVSIMTGAFVYIFCGFGLFASVRHPYFINSMIYFPLILIGVEKILDGKRPWLFIIMVFVAAISNFYFFYMIAVLTAIYLVWRLISRYHWSELKWALLKIGEIVGCACLGVCLSACILLPVTISFLGDTRSLSDYLYHFFYTIGDYESNFGYFLSASDNHDWTCMGYAAIGLISIFLLFIQRKNWDIKIIFLILTIMSLLPVAGHIMNGFSYVSNRWIWGYSFIIAYIVVLKWRSIFTLTKMDLFKLSLCMAGYLVVCFIFVRSRSVSVFFALAMMFLSLLIVIAVKQRFGVKWSYMGLAVCVLVNICGNAVFLYSPRNSNYVAEFVDSEDTLTGLEETEEAAIRNVSNGESGFFRYSGSSTTINGTLFSGLYSTAFYWSLSNGNISQFREESALTYRVAEHSYKTLNSRTFLSELANVEYYVQDNMVPYGYTYLGLYDVYGNKLDETDESSLEKLNVDTFNLWKNDVFLPFGYTYDGYIERSDYDAMTPLERQEAMMQGCVVETELAEGEEAQLVLTGVPLPYEVTSSYGLTYEDGLFDVTESNANITLTFEGLDNAECYLYLTGLDYSGYTPRELYSDEEWDALSTYEKNQVEYQEKYYEEPTSLDIYITTVDTDGFNSANTLTYYTPYYTWYGNRTDFLTPFGYDANGRASLTITFPTPGVYTFDSMEVLCQPMDNYVGQVTLLAEDVLENVDFHENSANATNHVTGTISLDSPKYLLLTIPYSNGWTAQVDGEEQKLIQANTMYMALYLTAGEHDIELNYTTPGLTTGLVVSIIGLTAFIILILWVELRRKSTKNRPKKEKK